MDKTHLFKLSSNTNYPLINGLSYYAFDFWYEIGDPRTRDLPLMSNGPWTLCTIMLAYLLFVKKIGPQLMKERQPYTLRHLMLAYNLLLVGFNIYFFIEALICIRFGRNLFDFKFPNQRDVSPEAMRMVYSGYAYFLTKLLDLFDTIFFVFRKKYSQISVLHLYHHTIVPMLGWLAVSISPTAAPIGLIPIVNSLIHAIMYTYYALSSMGPEYKKYLWWKKWITVLQMNQFVLFGVYYTAFVILQTGYPFIYLMLGFVQPFIFFYMFLDFFRKAYNVKNRIKSN